VAVDVEEEPVLAEPSLGRGDSILVRLMPRSASSTSSSASAPVRSAVIATSEVRSAPVGVGSSPGRRSNRKRVAASATSATSVARAASG